MQRVQDQDNGISIKFDRGKSRKGNYRLVSQSSDNKGGCNGTKKSGEQRCQLSNIKGEKKKGKTLSPSLIPSTNINSLTQSYDRSFITYNVTTNLRITFCK